MAADNFFSRWSQRKQAVREGRPLPAPELERPQMPGPVAQGQTDAPLAVPGKRPGSASAQAPKPASAQEVPTPAPALPPPPLSLQDAEQLSIESDFSPFVKQGVDPQVRNAAMKKLFADPRFNVMDGLDTYIDDYSRPDPLPLSMLKQMASAQFLRLVDAPEAPAATRSGKALPAEKHAAVPEEQVASVPEEKHAAVPEEQPAAMPAEQQATVSAGASVPAGQGTPPQTKITPHDHPDL